MKRIISGLLTVAMLITSPGLVHASNQTTNVSPSTKLTTGKLYPTTVIEDIADDFSDETKFVHYIYGTGEEIENEHNNNWKDYGTKYFYNLYGEFERDLLLEDLELVCMDYLSTDLNAVESIDKDGNVQYHTGYFIVQNWITQNEVYNLVEIFKYNNPQYYFLNDVIRITNIEGITVFSIGIYDEFAKGDERAKATKNFGMQITSWKNVLDTCTTKEAKVRKIQELICNNVDPITEKDSLSQSAYSVLCSNESACAGYSKAFSLMSNAIGLDAISVTSENHQWNKVRVEDQWYNIDTFLADETSGINYKYYLRSDDCYDSLSGENVDFSETKLWRNKLPNCLFDSKPSDNGQPGILPVINEQAQAPKFRVTALDEGFNAYIGSPSIGATIYYTLDGSDPSMASSKSIKGNGGVYFETGTTLKAIAVLDGYYDSEIATWDGTVWEEELNTIYENGVYYNLKVDDSLVGYYYDDCEAEVLEIPEEVNGHKVSEINMSTENTAVKKIILPKYLLKFECTSFTNIQEIVVDEENPFLKVVDGILYDKKGEILYYCPPMYQGNNIVLDKKVGVIADNAFKNCVNLTKVELPDDLYRIGNNAFDNCTSLKEIHVEYSEVEKYLNNMELDESSYVSFSAFSNAPALETIDIPGGISCAGGIGEERSTATFTIMPNYNVNPRVAEIFYNAKKIMSYTGTLVDEYCASQNLLFESIEDIDELIYQYEDLGNNEIRIIAVNAHSPKEHVIPETIDGKKVVEIGTGYISGVLPSLVKELGSPTPPGETIIEKLILPKTLRLIDSHAFSSATVDEIIIPDGVEKIETNAFFGAHIERVTIPESVKLIGWSAFAKTSFLTEVNLLCDVRSYENVFDESAIKEIKFPEGACSISLSKMNNLEKLTLPETVSSFRYEGDCGSLKELNVPGEVFDIYGDFSNLAENGCVINGDTNSAMEKVCNEYGVKFNSVGTIEKTDFTFVCAMEKFTVCGDTYSAPAKDGSIYIDDYLGNETEELIIPNSYGNKKIVGIGEYGTPTHVITKGIKRIVVEEGIKNIEKFGILNKIPYEEIVLPRSISYIDDEGLYLGYGSEGLVEIYGYVGSYVEDWVKYIKEKSSSNIAVEFRNVEVDKFIYELVKITPLERGKDCISFKWNKVEGASGYNIYRRTSNTSWEKIQTIDGDMTFTFTDTDLESGNEYYYCVRGYKGNLECDYTEESMYYLEIPKIKEIKQDGYKITITWEPVKGAQRYELSVQQNDGTWFWYDAGEDINYSLELYEDRVEDSDVFKFKIQASSSEPAGYSYYTEEYQSIIFKKPVKIQVPFQPTDVFSSLTNYNAVKISWQKVNNADGYLIYYMRNGLNEWKLLGTTQGTEYKKSGLIADTNYRFRIVSYCIVDGIKYYNEQYYSEIAIDTQKKLATPTNIKVSLYGHDDVKVTWDRVAGANIYYVYFKKSTASKYTYVGKTTSLSFKKGNLTDNVTYNVKIVPYYIKGGVETSGWSSGKKNIDTLKNVQAPKSFTPLLYGYDDVKVSWTKCSGATGYYIYCKKANAKSYTYLGSTKGLSYKKANLTDGVKYTFKIIPYYTKNGKLIKSYYSKTANIYTLKKINKPVVKKYSAGKIKISWNNIEGESGYQISRSTSKTGTGIISTIGSNSSKYKVVSATKGKTYYYKVRAYKIVSGKKIYGPWSSVASYKLK